MSDHSLPPHVTLSCGRSGSGKTTFCFRYLVNAATEQPANDNPTACTFIFDWKLEACDRLGLSPCGTVAQCEAAVPSRWVAFDPHIMFPGTSYVTNPEGQKILNDERMALRWFCRWVFDVSRRGPGKKIVYIDELKNFASKFWIPPELGRIARMGRAENLELLSSTQYPRDYHTDLRGAVTEWVCFSNDEQAELDTVREYFPDIDQVKTFPLGTFVGFNRETKAQMRGKLF